MPITPEKLVNCIRLCTITINIEVRQFRQSVFASVACILYDQPIPLIHVKQPHDSFLTVLVITGLPSRGVQTYSVGLQKLAPQHLIAGWRDCQGFEKNLDISDLQNLAAKHTTGLS